MQRSNEFALDSIMMMNENTFNRYGVWAAKARAFLAFKLPANVNANIVDAICCE